MYADYGWLYNDSEKEIRAIGYAMKAFKEKDCRLFGVEQNSFSKEMEHKIVREACSAIDFNNFIDSDGNEVKIDPPDFYFNNSKIALELFYASDITLDNGYNPEVISFKNRMSRIKTEYKEYEKFASISRYRKNLMRTIKNHFGDKDECEPSLKHWSNRKNFEFSYKGFLIVDLGHLYVDSDTLMDCECKCIPHLGKKVNHLNRISSYQSIYMPWRDANIMEYFYKYDCDFVIWWQPRRYDEIMFDKPKIGEIAVIDTRDKSKLDSSLKYREFIRLCDFYDYSLITYDESDYDNMVVVCSRGVFDNKDSEVK